MQLKGRDKPPLMILTGLVLSLPLRDSLPENEESMLTL